MRGYVERMYDKARSKESVIIVNAVDRMAVLSIEPDWLSEEKHVVYSAAKPHWGDGHFRDMRKTVREITGRGIHLHVYALIVVPGLKAAETDNSLLHIHEGLTGRTLAQELTKYDAGIINHESDDPVTRVHIDMSSPNKLYEEIHKIRAEMHDGIKRRDLFPDAIDHLDEVIVYLFQEHQAEGGDKAGTK